MSNDARKSRSITGTIVESKRGEYRDYDFNNANCCGVPFIVLLEMAHSRGDKYEKPKVR